MPDKLPDVNPYRAVNMVALTLLLGLLAWVGRSTVELSVAMAEVQTEIRQLSLITEQAAGNRYNQQQASSDWSRQALIDQQQTSDISEIKETIRELRRSGDLPRE